MKDLIKLLSLEARYKINDEILEQFLSEGKTIKLSPREALIDFGEYKPDIYVVKKGLIRGFYQDKNNEKTAGFALPGTILISYLCYYSMQPSYHRFEALAPSEVVVIPQNHFNKMIYENHQFCLWSLSMVQNQLYHFEYRDIILTGDATDRLRQLLKRLESDDIIDFNSNAKTKLKENDKVVLKEVNERWKKIYKIVPSKVLASYLGISEVHLSRIKKELLKEYQKSRKI